MVCGEEKLVCGEQYFKLKFFYISILSKKNYDDI